MPALVALLCCVALGACAVPNVAAVTNAEFYDLIKDYIEDVEIIDTSEDIDVENDDVIALPGGPDDELDVGYLIEKLGLSGNEKAPRKVGFLNHYNHNSGSCHCYRGGCQCHLTRTFSVCVGCHTYRFQLQACIEVAYLSCYNGYRITFKINNHILVHREMSLRYPPRLCYAVPGADHCSTICLNFYNINLWSKYMCAKLTGYIYIKHRKVCVNLGLGCFTIPHCKEKAMAELLNDRTVVQIDAKPSDDADETISPDVEKEYESSDLTDMFRQLREELEE